MYTQSQEVISDLWNVEVLADRVDMQDQRRKGRKGRDGWMEGGREEAEMLEEKEGRIKDEETGGHTGECEWRCVWGGG